MKTNRTLGILTGIPRDDFRAASDDRRSYAPPDPWRPTLQKRPDHIEQPTVTRPSGAGRYAPPDPYALQLERERRRQEQENQR